MKCSIIIPVYNNANFTKMALDDLICLSSDFEIIFVDNGSTDDTAIIIGQAIQKNSKDRAVVRYVLNKENLGFSKSNNIGMEISNGEYVLFLNNDIKIKEGKHAVWLDSLIKKCGDCIVGAQVGKLDKDYTFKGEGKFDPMVKGAYLSGWCLLAKRSTWDKLTDDKSHPWNESFFLYFEDGDLSWRAKKIGIQLKLIEDIPIFHFSRSTGRKYNMFSFYHKSRRIFKKIWRGELV